MEGNDKPWVMKRKALLAKGGPRKVILLAYMRGGSSIGGEMFSRDPRAVYWYEPLASFYMAHYGLSYAAGTSQVMYERDRRTNIALDATGQKALFTFFDDMFHCRYNRLPTASWTHRFLKFSHSPALQPLKQCVLHAKGKSELDGCSRLPSACSDMESSRRLNCREAIAEASKLVSKVSPGDLEKASIRSTLMVELSKTIGDNNAANVPKDSIFRHLLCVRRLGVEREGCRNSAQVLCRGAKIHAAKVLRLAMSEVHRLLVAMPDVHVVHYVRDPRATAASRLASRGNDTLLLEEVEFLCTRMAADLEAKSRLEREFPEAFLEVRYEDLVLQPIETAQKMFGFFGMNTSKEWAEFAKTVLPLNKSDSVIRARALRSLSGWVTKFSKHDLQEINVICKNVFEKLRYPPI